MITKLDHLVIAASDLVSGVHYVQDQLGVQIPFGGRHDKMGTHNHLMKLADDKFIEVIAINPQAKQPDCPRWYGLDDPVVQHSITVQPRLIAWVVNTDDIDQVLGHADFDFGQPELITRDHLNWYFSLPEDGRLLAGGMIPYIMQWNTQDHPAANMADLGCEFVKLDVFHPHPSWFSRILGQIGVDKCIGLHPLSPSQSPYLKATIKTPLGIKQLSSHI